MLSKVCFTLLVLLLVQSASARFGGRPSGGSSSGGGAKSCSNNVHQVRTPTRSSTCENWSSGNSYSLPFQIENKYAHYQCPDSNKRIFVSNGIPNHSVTQANPNAACELPWRVEMPLSPTTTDTLTEPAPLGIVAMGMNGVPSYGAQEGSGGNAAEPGAGAQITDAQYWYGHASPNKDWHYHSPSMGSPNPTSSTLLAYALDGFPIYGPMSDSEVGSLDSCNGRQDPTTGDYQYHARSVGQVDETADYCDGTSRAVAWKYVVGCYRGAVAQNAVSTCSDCTVPSDCTLVNSANVDQMSFFDGVDGAASPAPLTPPATTTPAPATPTASPTAPTNSQQIRGQVRFTGRGVRRWNKGRTAGVKRVMRHRFRKFRRKKMNVSWKNQRRSDDSESITMEFEVDTDLTPEQMPELLDEMRLFLTKKSETGFCKEFAVDADDELVSESSVTSLSACEAKRDDDVDEDKKKSKGPPVLVIVGASAGVMMLLLLGAGFVFWQWSSGDTRKYRFVAVMT